MFDYIPEEKEEVVRQAQWLLAQEQRFLGLPTFENLFQISD